MPVKPLKLALSVFVDLAIFHISLLLVLPDSAQRNRVLNIRVRSGRAF